MSNKPNTMVPVIATIAFAVIGLVVAAIGGITSGSIAGGLIAGIGIVPACYGMWAGMQQETQASLAMNILAFLFAVGVAGILILLKFVDWLR